MSYCRDPQTILATGKQHFFQLYLFVQELLSKEENTFVKALTYNLFFMLACINHSYHTQTMNKSLRKNSRERAEKLLDAEDPRNACSSTSIEMWKLDQHFRHPEKHEGNCVIEVISVNARMGEGTN